MPRKGSGAPLSPSLILSSLARLDKQIDASLKARSIGSAVRGRCPPRGIRLRGRGNWGRIVRRRTDGRRTWTRHELTHLGTAVFSLVRRATLSAAPRARSGVGYSGGDKGVELVGIGNGTGPRRLSVCVLHVAALKACVRNADCVLPPAAGEKNGSTQVTEK